MSRISHLVAISYLLLGVASCWAAPGVAFTDAKYAGPDFTIQGEYTGRVKLGDQETKLGVQIIARGNGKFDGVFFTGGLPGDGWKRGDKQESVKGEPTAGGATFKGTNWSAKIADGKLSLADSGGTALGTLEKVERKSPTLGAKPPEGAVVLFDGSNANAFKNGKIVEGNLLDMGTQSNQEFQDFTVHVEFRTPFMPLASGQGRGNSGVYLQNRYEVQVLDSFGLDGADNECGGIYKFSKPAVNMCFPPLSWQTYDIDFTAARFEGEKKVKNARATIKHNGMVIHNDLEFPDLTPGGARTEFPGKGPFSFQNHGNPVRYRNIWVVEKKS